MIYSLCLFRITPMNLALLLGSTLTLLIDTI